jgi:hypothetical protein
MQECVLYRMSDQGLFSLFVYDFRDWRRKSFERLILARGLNPYRLNNDPDSAQTIESRFVGLAVLYT